MKNSIFKSENAVSEVVGYMIILSLIVLAVSVMMITAYPMLTSTKESAYMDVAMQGITIFDSKSSLVAFSTSPSQMTSVDLRGGSLNADNKTYSQMQIIVKDYSGNETIIYNESLGTLEYTLNDQTIAYEGGGVFRKYPTGDPMMITPPEFHYNGETLTLPIVRIINSASTGGSGVVNMYSTAGSGSKIIYPNITSPYNLTNPLMEQQIKVRIKSEYYKAWAKYIIERTEATTLTNDATHEVVVSLNSNPSDRDEALKMPIEIMGLDATNETPLKKFMFNLTNVTSDYHMVLRAPTSTSDDFVLEMQKRGGNGTTGMNIMVWYNKDGYNETWLSETEAIIIGNNASINLLNSTANATYNSNDLSGTWQNESWPYNKSYIKSGEKGPIPLEKVIQHYIKLVSDTGTFALYPGQHTSPNDPEWKKGFSTEGSTFSLYYAVMPPRITYLHIVEHPVNIRFE